MKETIIIEKIPLPPEQKFVDKQPNFPRVKTLYLELIENKAKIKPNLVNKDYNPDKQISTSKPVLNFVDNSDDEEPAEKENFETKFDNIINKKDSPSSQKTDKEKNKDTPDSDNDLQFISKRDKKDRRGKREKYSNLHDEPHHDEPHNDDNKSVQSDGLSVRLRELLKDDASVGSPEPKRDKYSMRRDEPQFNQSPRSERNNRDDRSPINNGNEPPTLSELESKGGYVRKKEMRNLDYVSRDEHDEEDSKRELMFKFELLKKSYPSAVIPEFSIHTEYSMMKRSYDNLLRRLSLDTKIDQYKTYLIGGFMGMEFLLGKFLKFDMQGFTSQQILSMNKYEKLLIELGEKSYVPEGEGWSIEVRLIFLVVVQTVLFVVSKLIMKSTGANLMGMINGMNNASSGPAPQRAPTKKKMAGPNIDIADLP